MTIRANWGGGLLKARTAPKDWIIKGIPEEGFLSDFSSVWKTQQDVSAEIQFVVIVLFSMSLFNYNL